MTNKKLLTLSMTFFVSLVLLSCSNSKSFTVISMKQDLSDCSTPIDPIDTVIVGQKAIVGFFEITEIKKIKDAYIIMCVKDSLIYQIISLKSKKKGEYRIKKNERYSLTVNPYYKENCMPGSYMHPIYIKGKELLNIRRKASNIYTTPNLEGLYYIEPIKQLHD